MGDGHPGRTALTGDTPQFKVVGRFEIVRSVPLHYDATDLRYNHAHDKGGKFASKTGGGFDAGAVESDLSHGKSVTVSPDHIDSLMRTFAGGPVFNLEHMHVSGAENKNCFDKHARDIPRGKMPQLPEDVHALGAFNSKLAERGIKAHMESVDPRSLTATQNELDASKVGKLYGAIRDGGWRSDAILFASREGDVLDGHHRWAAASAANMAGSNIRVNVVRVDTDIDTLLDIANTVSLPRKSLGAALNPGRSVRSQAVSFGETPTTPPPDENEPWFWIGDKWYLVVTDTSDGVPEELNLPAAEGERSTGPVLDTHYVAPPRLHDGHYDARFNSVHDAHSGKFASKGGVGASAGGDMPDVHPTGTPGVVVVGGRYLRAGDTFKHGGKTYKVTPQGEAQAVLKRTAPRPAMRAAKTTTKNGETTAFKEDGNAEFPTRDGGTQKVGVIQARWMSGKEFHEILPTTASPAEWKALQYYDRPTGAGHINWYLRGQETARPEALRSIQHLDALMAKHTLPEGVMVTRRVGYPGLGIPNMRGQDNIDRAIAASVGHVIQDKGYVSTTLMADVSRIHPEYKDLARINMHIALPKGTHAVALESVAKEVLLPRDTKIAITGAKKLGGGQWQLNAQVVPPK